MTERLTAEEIALLNDALEDGFRDDYLPGAPLVKLNMGNLFHTNPLSDDVVYYLEKDHLDEDRLRISTDRENRSSSNLFSEESWESNIFWRNSFGFNFEKVEAYFRLKENEVLDELKSHYSAYLEKDEFDLLIEDHGLEAERRTFKQWIEGRLYPYTKRWFEKHIMSLCRDVKYYKERMDEPSRGYLSDFWMGKLLISAVTLGRMVEHYRWKFQFEAQIVGRRQHFEKAGSGGARSSAAKRVERLEVFMKAIEQLGALAQQFDEDVLVEQAFKMAAAQNDGFWKVGRGQAERYATHLRSEEPFKSRYFAVFRKSA